MKYELVNFCEIDTSAIKSYCAIHNVDVSKNLGDIEKIDEKIISQFNFMVGGTPCQDFSISGAKKGAVWHCNLCSEEYNPLTVKPAKRRFCPQCGGGNITKTRSSLLVEWLRILEHIKPDVAIYENVKNILSTSFRDMFDLFVAELEESGYSVYYDVLNAKCFGVPQNRERLYMVIIKKEKDNGQFQFPKQCSNEAQLGDFLVDIDCENLYESCLKGVFIDKRIKPSVRRVYEENLAEIINCEKEMYQCKCKSGFQDCKVGIKLAPTLRAGNPHTAVLYENCIRKLVPIENVRLMGFGDSDFQSMQSAMVSNAQIYKQTGNSIVVNVLVDIYRELYKVMPYLFDNIKLGSFFSGIGAFEKALTIL